MLVGCYMHFQTYQPYLSTVCVYASIYLTQRSDIYSVLSSDHRQPAFTCRPAGCLLTNRMNDFGHADANTVGTVYAVATVPTHFNPTQRLCKTSINLPALPSRVGNIDSSSGGISKPRDISPVNYSDFQELPYTW